MSPSTCLQLPPSVSVYDLLCFLLTCFVQLLSRCMHPKAAALVLWQSVCFALSDVVGDVAFHILQDGGFYYVGQ